ncbi:MAG: DUF3857 domain-containing protein [candidate division KSB1 bacterium]|nr:DUF3857 domain-containing protein [candidate division KSB1 bacterium]MDZ7340967.1 DUF3857 domain-containing protein [candidate division KSB1 bacterium]
MPKKLKMVFTAMGVIGLMFCLFCAHDGDWIGRQYPQARELADVELEKEFPDADALILLDEANVDILSVGSMPLSIFERHRVIKILNPRGQRYAFVTIPYSSQSQVDRIRAQTIAPDGKIFKLDKKKIYDVNLYPEFIFYSDQRAKIFTLPAVAPGSVIDINYSVQLRSYSLWPVWNFQDYSPTLRSKFHLSAPSEWEIKYRLHNLDIQPQIARAPAGFKSTYTWEAAHVPPLRPEFGMPSLNDCLARLEIAPAGMSTWSDVAAWYYELADPQTAVSKAIRSKAMELTAAGTTPEDKLRFIFEWVRDQVRYVAVEIGIGSFQPHSADEVLWNRYGDCKDMTTLICALARAASLEVYPALISTWQNGIADTSLPSPLQFNHAIAYCPNIGTNGTWMDATDNGCAFGQLPWYDQGLPALVIQKNSEYQILFTPHLPADSNRLVMDWQVHLDSTGRAEITGTTHLTGIAATEMRRLLYFLPQDLQRNWFATDLANRCPGASVSSLLIHGSSPMPAPLILRYVFHVDVFSAESDQKMSFRPGQILAFDLPNHLRASSRQHPIQFRGGSFNELNLVIDLPEKWQLISPLWNDSLTSSFGNANWKSSQINNQLTIQMKYQLNGEPVLPDQFPAFQKFIDQIQHRNLKEILVGRKEQIYKVQNR